MSNPHATSMALLWDDMNTEQQIRFIGQRLRLMSSAKTVQALRYLSEGQLNDVMAMLNGDDDAAD